jgi:hypothetical protein
MYLTWGRRFGGIQCFTPEYCSPVFIDFDQMQDSLTRAYKMTADSVAAWIAPAGEAWRLVLHTTGMVLHDADDSHPNLNGSYLAACVFYDVIFGKPSAGNPFTAGLDPDTALILQAAADSITFGHAELWNLGNDVPEVSFVPTVSTDTLFTDNTSTGAGFWTWNFGDGATSDLFEPVHVYASPGVYPVKLKGCGVCYCDSVVHQVTVTTTGIRPAGENRAAVRLAGPDQSGMVYLSGFRGNGTLVIYSMTGQCAAACPVLSGTAETGKMANGVWMWTLKAPDGQILATGKIAR